MFRPISRLLVAFLLLSTQAHGQSGVVPTMGKEFWCGFMKNYGGNTPASLDIFISSQVNTSGTVKMPLLGLNYPFVVAAGVTTTVTVPIPSAMHVGSEFVDNKSILIQSNDTVAVFAINFEAYTADAQVVYPVQSIGNNYRVFSYIGLPGFTDLVAEFLIVATKDNTEVEITTTAATVGGHAANVPWIVQLDSGETYQVQAADASTDFTGSTCIGTPASGSCRPFAVFSGVVCTDIPAGCTACDHICEENLPTNVWGSTYYSVPFATTTSYTYRILSDLNGTQVSVNGGAPILLNAGSVVDVPNFSSAACFTGNQPFAVAQYMQGITCSGNGDPALLILNSEEQKISDITFGTVVSTVITNHYLNVIVETASANSVTLDGVPVPVASFTNFPSCPTHSYAQVPLTPGSHRLQCPAGVSAYVYGMGSAESYAYSVGAFTPVPPLIVDSVFCGLDSTGTLTLSPPVPLLNPFWTVISNPNDTLYQGLSYTFVPPGSDVYVVTGYENLSQCEDQYLFSVEIADPPVLALTANGLPGPLLSICAYTPVQLNVTPTPGGTYLYNWWPDYDLDDGSLPNPVATPTHSGWFHVSVSTLNGCAVAIDSIYVGVIPGDVLLYDVTTPDDQLCLGDSTQLNLRVDQVIASDTLDTGWNSMWTSVTGGVINNVCGSVSGNSLYFTNAGTRAAETVDFNLTAGGTVRFFLKIANGLAPCEDADAGDNVVLEYSTNGGGAWTTTATYFEFMYPNFTMIDVSFDNTSPMATATTRFRWKQVGAWIAGEDNWMLDNVSVAATSPAGLNFAWTPASQVVNSTIQSPMAYPTLTGWFLVQSTDLNTSCVYSDSVYITVGQPFSIDVPNDTVTCDIAGFQLYATPSSGTGHVWSWTPTASLNAGFIENPIATPNTTTEYFVTVTSAQGCSATDSVTITVGPQLSLNVTASDVDLCAGEDSQLNAVVVGAVPSLTYTWTPSSWLDDATINDPLATPLAPVTYLCTLTDTISGCALVDSVYINVTNLYYAIATADTTVCSSFGLALDVVHNVPAPFTILWGPSALLSSDNTASTQIFFDSTMQYTVQISDVLGCSAFDTVNVTVSLSDLAVFSDSSLCAGDSAFIDASYPGSTYLWSTSETTAGIWVDAAGTYNVTVTGPDGCQRVLGTNITVDALPIVSLGPDTSLCVGQTWTLNAGNPGSTYQWSNALTTQQITVSSSNVNYWVQVTNPATCVSRDSISVVFDPLPVIDLQDTTVCISETIILDAENPGSWYVWNTGETTQTIDVDSTSGTYNVVVTTNTFCVDSGNVSLTFIPFLVVDIGPDSALCDGEQITLDAGNPGEAYTWHNGASSQTITLFDDVTAWVDVFNGYCTTRDSAEIVFNPNPVPVLPAQIITCLDYPPHYFPLDAGNSDCTFNWSTGEHDQVILANTYGQFFVHVTTPLNCTLDDTVLVVEYCNSALYVPNTFTPDGDGVNDLFYPLGNNVSTAELSIFDRWGELIYNGKDDKAAWDAKFNGTDVQDGVYIWKVKYRFLEDTNGTLSPEYEEVGHVTVIR